MRVYNRCMPKFNKKTGLVGLVFVITLFFIVLCGKSNNSSSSPESSQEASISSSKTDTGTDTKKDTSTSTSNSSNDSTDSSTSVASNSSTSTVSSTNTITSTNTNPANHAPTINVTSPNGSNFFIAGTQVPITYTASDSDNNTLSFKIEYSTNNGSSWILIENGVSSQTVNWDTTGLVQGIQYRIKVTVDDGNGGTASDTSNSAFGIASSDITYTNNISSLMASNCSPCHDQGGSDSSFFVRTPYSGSLNPGNATIRTKIQSQVINTQAMPPGGMSSANRQLIQLWLWNSGKQ